MKKIITKIKTLPILPVVISLLLMLSILLATCLAVIAIPIFFTGIVTFYGIKTLSKKNDIINDYEKGNANIELLENLKVLFAQSFNTLFQNGDNIPKLLINEITTETFQRNNITFYRLICPISVIKNVTFGTLENLKTELQDNIDTYSMTARFIIPVYYADKNNVTEETVRLYEITTTDTSIFFVLYIIEDENSFCFYQQSLK